MLQLAMALSLNDQQQQQQQQNQAQLAPIQPPATLPRSLLTADATNQQADASATRPLSRQNSNTEVAKPSPSTRNSKRNKPTSSTSSLNTTTTSTSTTLPDSHEEENAKESVPQYLLNSSLKLFHLRKTLLEKFATRIESPTCAYYEEEAYGGGGLKAIAFFQCVLALMADLNPKEESDRKLLDAILGSLLNTLKPLKSTINSHSSSLSATTSPIYVRTAQHEVMLVSLRTVSILLSKSKYQRSGDNCNFIIQTLLAHLGQFGLVDVCLQLAKHVYFDYWKKMDKDASGAATDMLDSTPLPPLQTQSAAAGLMKLSCEAKYYDELGPYFVRDPLNKDSFVVPPLNLLLAEATTTATVSTTTTTAKSSSSAAVTNATTTSQVDLFDNYAELLTEILIRLPYQMKKLCLGGQQQTQSGWFRLPYSLSHVY